MFDEKEIQWDLVPLILLVLLCICSLQGCGGFALIRQPEPGCRVVVTSEAAGSQFTDQLEPPQARTMRFVRRKIIND